MISEAGDWEEFSGKTRNWECLRSDFQIFPRINGLEHNKMKNVVKEIISTILYILAVLLGTYLLITFVGQRTSVSGSSMELTLSNNDQLILDKISYRFSEPKRFDIIVFPFNIKRILTM